MRDRESEQVEGPLIEQLQLLGWGHVAGDVWDPGATERGSFGEVFIETRLRSALRRINVDDQGRPWLGDQRVAQAVSALQKAGGVSQLVEANQKATELLQTGTVVPGVDGWDGGRDRTVAYVDWENPANNDFLAVSQFRVDEPGGQARRYITPDVVLFVNGIPLVVMECKAPGPPDAMADAINQLRRYANRRPEVETAEGNERLFWTNQVLVATTRDVARAGTITADAPHFMEWKDTAPVPVEELAAQVGKGVQDLSGQELLAAGMLRPDHLLDVVRHFTVFMQAGRKNVKAVARYQQYRAVQRAVERLRTGKTRLEDGEFDRRSGIIWHTQGSGKSLTMVFLVRKMRSDPALRRFKVVVVTDRTTLQRQLRATAELSGETVEVAESTHQVRELLSRPGPGLVMAMIQKYRNNDVDEGQGESVEFGELNNDEAILVLVDEAHRSHSSTLHANLLGALPNAARIGFTGTPIVMGAKKKTHEIFGTYLDQYTLSESQADESTVPIFYEGRTTEGAVRGASGLDEVFFEWFEGLSDDEREELQGKYASISQVLEAPEMIAAKAHDMLRHYATSVMPQRLKGMVVATSRKACVRYREALLQARDELVGELERLDQAIDDLEGDQVDELPRDQQLLVRARPNLDLIRRLDFVPVISGSHNDDPAWSEWTDKDRQAGHVEAFQQPLGTGEDARSDPTAMLIVKSMLLTGFDAPVAQVMYLDRLIREAELLQAIARVNRPADGKDYGLVVDYYGVARHLSEALAVYTSDDIKGALRGLSGEIERLGGRHQRVRQFFIQHGVEPIGEEDRIEQCVQLLADERLRATFDVDLNRFLTSLDVVLPRPEARPYIADAKLFADIQRRVRQRYRDHGAGGFDPSLYREKVRQLIDEHVTVLDLSRKIPPVSVTDLDFSAKVADLPSDRAKASEMEHAARHHIRIRFDQDPARYQKLSERLDEILERLGHQWDQLALELDEFVHKDLTDEDTDEYVAGLDPKVHGPFYRLLADELPDADNEQEAELVELTRGVVTVMGEHIPTVGFWDSSYKRDQLRRQLKRRLDQAGLYPLATCDALATRLVDLARANHDTLLEQEPGQ